MSTSFLMRAGGYVALLGGIAWILLSLESIARPGPESYRTALFLIPWTLSAAGIVGLHLVQRGRLGRLGTIGFWVTIGGMAAGIVGTIANLADFEALMWLEIPVAPVVWVIGMLLYGIATVRAGVVPQWAGIALILAEPMTILVAVALSPWVPLEDEGSYSGALANGIAFLAVGIAMRLELGPASAPDDVALRSSPASP